MKITFLKNRIFSRFINNKYGNNLFKLNKYNVNTVNIDKAQQPSYQIQNNKEDLTLKSSNANFDQVVNSDMDRKFNIVSRCGFLLHMPLIYHSFNNIYYMLAHNDILL